MGFVTLGTALENALASMMDCGDQGGVDAPSGALKKTGAVDAPASGVSMITQPEGEPSASPVNVRCEPTHPQAQPQRRVGSHLRLVIDNGVHFRPPRRYTQARHGLRSM